MRGLIMFKRRELLVPELYMDKALKEFPHALCVAAARKTGLIIERNEGTFELKSVMDLQQELVDDEAIFWLMDSETYEADDVQPYIIKGKQDNEEIIGFADGKFPNFIPSASNHCNEYFLFNKYIIPKINGFGPNLDADGVMNNLGNDIVKMELQGICGDRGTILFLAKNGRIIPFEKNDRKGEFDWGWVSDHLDYKEVKVEKPQLPTLTKLGNKLKAIASVEPIKQPVERIVEEVKTDTAIPQEEVKTFTFQPDRGLSYSELKKQYKRITGSLPYNWRDRPAVQYKRTVTIPEEPKKVLKSFSELDKTKYATEQPAVVEGEIPILSPKTLEALQTLDKNSIKIRDPEFIAADMGKYPNFWEETGIAKNITDGWDWATFKDFGTKNVFAVIKLAWSYRNAECVGEDIEAATSEPDTSGTGVLKESAPTVEPKQETTAPKPTGVVLPKLQRKRA